MDFLKRLLSWLFPATVMPRVTNNLGELAIPIALHEIGKGEIGGNNAGKDVMRYRRGKDTKGAWCASFVSYCLEEGAALADVECPPVRSAGAKRLFKNCLAAGAFRVQEPQRGDIALWQRGVKNSWKGHVGIVQRVLPDGTFVCIEGNRGRFPAMVDTFKHQLGEPSLLGFLRFPDDL